MNRRTAGCQLVAGMVVLFLVSGATAAVAYWHATGSGAVSGTVGAFQPVTVVALAGESPSTSLLPGGPAADVVIKVTNQNPFEVKIVAVALTGAITAGNGCSPAGVSFATPTNLPVTLVPGTSVVHLAGGSSMDSTSASACQGASFSFPLTLTVYR